MKKFLGIVLCAMMVLAMFACTSAPAASNAPAASDNKTENSAPAANEPAAAEPAAAGDTFKVGVVLVGDENEGYTYAHIIGVQKALANLGLNESNVVWKYAK